jgi:hypothetical protein
VAATRLVGTLHETVHACTDLRFCSTPRGTSFASYLHHYTSLYITTRAALLPSRSATSKRTYLFRRTDLPLGPDEPVAAGAQPFVVGLVVLPECVAGVEGGAGVAGGRTDMVMKSRASGAK